MAVNRQAPDAMRVAIDLTALMPSRTGVDTYLIELVRSLSKIDRTNCYTVFVNVGDRHQVQSGLGPNFSVRACCVRSRALRLIFQQCAIPLVSSLAAYDVVHSPSFLMPLSKGRSRHLLTVHDLTFFSMPEVHNRLRRSRAFRRLVATSIRRADLLNVPSETTRRELCRWIPQVRPDRIRITPWGVDTRFAPAAKEEVAQHVKRLGLPQSYILHLGTIEPRKNLLTLLESYRRLLAGGDVEAHLVLAGAVGWNAHKVLEMVKLPALRGRVCLPGYIADADLAWVYRGASLFVCPSLCEGFGFPPLEAMACGTPVIASDDSSLGENLRGAAELVAACDVDAIVAAMRRLLSDADGRRRCAALGVQRAATFRWEHTAQAVVACYRELSRPQRHQRPSDKDPMGDRNHG